MILSNYFQQSTKVERILGVASIIFILIFYWTSRHVSDPGEYVYKAEWLFIIFFLLYVSSLFLYNILLAVGKKITVIGKISLVSFVALILIIFLLSNTITPHEIPFIYEMMGSLSIVCATLINLVTVRE